MNGYSTDSPTRIASVNAQQRGAAGMSIASVSASMRPNGICGPLSGRYEIGVFGLKMGMTG
jgi:hypothetical protein